MSVMPAGWHPDVNAEAASKPNSWQPAALGWPDALQVRSDEADADAEPWRRLEAGTADLLALGHAVFDGVGLAVRLRICGLGDALVDDGGTVERDVCISWPPGSAGDELVPVEELVDAGPVLDAARSRSTVGCGDLTATQLWPGFTAAAVGLGVRSVLAVPIVDHAGCLGALVLYRAEIGDPASPETTARLVALASQVTVLLANATALFASNRTIAQLRDAMMSRSVIEQAKGVLIAREKIDAETAWEYLVRISQRTHRKLRDISTDIVGKASAGKM